MIGSPYLIYESIYVISAFLNKKTITIFFVLNTYDNHQIEDIDTRSKEISTKSKIEV
jgi:hypothetical protein